MTPILLILAAGAILPHREIALPLIDRITESIVGATAILFLAAFVWVSMQRDKREGLRWIEHTKSIVDMQLQHTQTVKTIQDEFEDKVQFLVGEMRSISERADVRSAAYQASVERISERWNASIHELTTAIDRRGDKSGG